MKRNSVFESSVGARKILMYVLGAALIAFLINMAPSYWLEEITAKTSSLILSQLGLVSSWFSNGIQAYVQVGNNVGSLTIEIVRECTGIHVIAIFSGLVLPLREADLKRKLIAVIMASVILFFLNITRVCLTIGLIFFNVFPFSIVFQNPTVETYHYPLSYLYGVLGVFILIVSADRLVLPELGDMLVEVVATLNKALSHIAINMRRASQ